MSDLRIRIERNRRAQFAHCIFRLVVHHQRLPEDAVLGRSRRILLYRQPQLGDRRVVVVLRHVGAGQASMPLLPLRMLLDRVPSSPRSRRRSSLDRNRYFPDCCAPKLLRARYVWLRDIPQPPAPDFLLRARISPRFECASQNVGRSWIACLDRPRPPPANLPPRAARFPCRSTCQRCRGRAPAILQRHAPRPDTARANNAPGPGTGTPPHFSDRC